MNQIIKQVNNAICLEVLVATTMAHVFNYTPYMDLLIKQVNQISFNIKNLLVVCIDLSLQ